MVSIWFVRNTWENKWIKYKKSFAEIFTWTILLSDNGLDDETPESDAHDFTDADRTIFGAVSSGGGDVEEVIVEVVSEGHDKAAANK